MCAGICPLSSSTFSCVVIAGANCREQERIYTVSKCSASEREQARRAAFRYSPSCIPVRARVCVCFVASSPNGK